MSDEIGYESDARSEQDLPTTRKLVPMRVGEAIVHVEETPGLVSGGGDDIYPVASSTEEAFERANEVLEECVRVVGERVSTLGDVKPKQITVEFSLTFEATGKSQIIPVLLTGETRAGAGLKVTAVWGD